MEGVSASDQDILSRTFPECPEGGAAQLRMGGQSLVSKVVLRMQLELEQTGWREQPVRDDHFN